MKFNKKKSSFFSLYSNFVPKWIYYPAFVIFILGLVKIISGSLKWGISEEQNYAIILTFIGFIITLIDDIGGYLKNKIKFV